MARHLIRLDADNYEHFRDQAHRTKNPGGATAIVNGLLRYAVPLAEAGVFNLPHEIILEALEAHLSTLVEKQSQL